ncbi:MAG: hypothetical protein K8R54_18665 [Bacteroidales bacterium]|nr:hypothetical protein [Bacteroidales bacterium]
MQIQRTQDELIIRFSSAININMEYLQKFLDYLRFIEISSKSQATEEQILELANDINQSWWQTNKSKFIQ